MVQVLEAHVCRQIGLLQKLRQRVHHRPPPSDRAGRVREDESDVAPGSSSHAFLKLAGAVCAQGATVRGPIPTRLSSPVLVVETRGRVLVSAK